MLTACQDTDSQVYTSGKGRIAFSLVFPEDSRSFTSGGTADTISLPDNVSTIRVIVENEAPHTGSEYLNNFDRSKGKAEFELDPSTGYIIHFQAFDSDMVLQYWTRLEDVLVRSGVTTLLGDIPMEVVQQGTWSSVLSNHLPALGLKDNGMPGIDISNGNIELTHEPGSNLSTAGIVAGFVAGAIPGFGSWRFNAALNGLGNGNFTFSLYSVEQRSALFMSFNGNQVISRLTLTPTNDIYYQVAAIDPGWNVTTEIIPYTLLTTLADITDPNNLFEVSFDGNSVSFSANGTSTGLLPVTSIVPIVTAGTGVMYWTANENGSNTTTILSVEDIQARP
jgi:hypothetical protein